MNETHSAITVPPSLTHKTHVHMHTHTHTHTHAQTHTQCTKHRLWSEDKTQAKKRQPEGATDKVEEAVQITRA